MNIDSYNRILAGESLTAVLSPRALWRLTGPDASRYLNGQVTNDVTRLADGQACYAAVCTAKGRMDGDVSIALHAGDFYLDADAVLRESLGAIVRQPIKCRRRRKPIPAALFIKVSRALSQFAQGLAKNRKLVAWLRARQSQARPSETGIWLPDQWRRAHKYGACRARGCAILGDTPGRVSLHPLRQRPIAVYFPADNRSECRIQWIQHARSHALIADRNARRRNQRVLGLRLPENTDDIRHESQYAAGSLEIRQASPVLGQTVEEFRVDRV